MSSSSDEEILDYFNELLGQDGSTESAKHRLTEEQHNTSKAAQADIEDIKREEKERSATLLSRAHTADFTSSRSESPVLRGPQSNEASNPSAFSEEGVKKTPALKIESPQNKPADNRNTAPVDLEALDALQREKKRQLQAMLDKGFENKTLISEPKVAPVVVDKKVQVKNSPQKRVEPVPPKIEPEIVEDEEQVTVSAELTRSVGVGLDYLAWADNGRPQWAQTEFDALLFKVAGLKLAVPLVCLGQIYPIDEDLPQIFGQADWFMGVQATPIGKLRIVNTALFVMPERYKPEFLKTARYVVSIDGIHWALAVDTVEQPIKLQPQDVTWRSQRGKRPWLAGTVKSAMCALIDIPNMGEMLEKSDKNRM